MSRQLCKIRGSRFKIEKPKPIEPEDLYCTNSIATTIQGVDPDDPEWVEKAAELVGAVSGDTYVKLDHGILTVNQIDMFLKAMPFELTFADDNNQFLYFNNAHQDPDTMFWVNVYVLNQEID